MACPGQNCAHFDVEICESTEDDTTVARDASNSCIDCQVLTLSQVCIASLSLCSQSEEKCYHVEAVPRHHFISFAVCYSLLLLYTVWPIFGYLYYFYVLFVAICAIFCHLCYFYCFEAVILLF